MAGAHNKFTIIDIDERGPASERLLADDQRQFGDSRVVVRTDRAAFGLAQTSATPITICASVRTSAVPVAAIDQQA
jgi:hypothetical protein